MAHTRALSKRPRSGSSIKRRAIVIQPPPRPSPRPSTNPKTKRPCSYRPCTAHTFARRLRDRARPSVVVQSPVTPRPAAPAGKVTRDVPITIPRILCSDRGLSFPPRAAINTPAVGGLNGGNPSAHHHKACDLGRGLLTLEGLRQNPKSLRRRYNEE